MICKLKKYRIFATFKQQNILILVCVALLFSTSTYCYATIRLSTLADCCASKVSNCSVARIREESLSLFKYFNFLTQMQQNEENASRSSITPQSTYNHETGNSFLTEKNIEKLTKLFKTPQDYARHIGCLWVFRDLVHAAIESAPKPIEHELFPLFETVNSFIGCMIRCDVHFDNRGRAYYYQNKKQVFI